MSHLEEQIVKDAVKFSFEYLSVVYHTQSLTNYTEGL